MRSFKSVETDGFEDCLENIEHIWGVPMVEGECSLFTMNDFDVTYYKDRKKYVMEVECAYDFHTKRDIVCYLRSILDKFSRWMKESGYNTEKKIDFNTLFYQGVSIQSEFDSIEDLYAAFAMFVDYYMSGICYVC